MADGRVMRTLPLRWGLHPISHGGNVHPQVQERPDVAIEF